MPRSERSALDTVFALQRRGRLGLPLGVVVVPTLVAMLAALSVPAVAGEPAVPLQIQAVEEGDTASDTGAEGGESAASESVTVENDAAGDDADPTAETAESGSTDATAEESEPMTVARVGEVLSRLDEEAQRSPDGTVMQITIEGTALMFVSDPRHNRMRLMSRIGPADALSEEQLMRIAQANFDTALDARYAVARGQIWSVYIHPLAELTETQLIEAVGQVVNAAESFGTTYSSGLLSFGGGDAAAAAQRELIDKLLKRGQPI
ncbi:MAG: hypothetical protein AAF899_02845 [Pseudomonadota bacterium]